MQTNSFTCIDTDSLPIDKFTYIRYSTGYEKWLNHLLGWSLNNCVVSVLLKFIVSNFLLLNAHTIKLPILIVSY